MYLIVALLIFGSSAGRGEEGVVPTGPTSSATPAAPQPVTPPSSTDNTLTPSPPPAAVDLDPDGVNVTHPDRDSAAEDIVNYQNLKNTVAKKLNKAAPKVSSVSDDLGDLRRSGARSETSYDIVVQYHRLLKERPELFETNSSGQSPADKIIAAYNRKHPDMKVPLINDTEPLARPITKSVRPGFDSPSDDLSEVEESAPRPSKKNVTEATFPQAPDPRILYHEDAMKLYADFNANQIPRRTTFAFANTAIPPGSRCSNSQKVYTHRSKASCTACMDQADSRNEAVHLSTYDLESVHTGYGWNTHTLTFTCSDVDKEEGLPSFVEGLEGMGVKLGFQRPGDAKLLQTPNQGPPGVAD